MIKTAPTDRKLTCVYAAE